MAEVIQFRPGDLEGKIAERWSGGKMGTTAKRDLERYYEIIENTHFGFSLHQMMAIVDTLQSEVPWSDAKSARRYLWAEIIAAEDVRDDLCCSSGARFSVDMNEIARKVRGLEPGAIFTLLDLVERVVHDWHGKGIPMSEEGYEESLEQALERHWSGFDIGKLADIVQQAKGGE